MTVDSGDRNWPNFLFVGPDKSGSTWLFSVLSEHPQVYVPRAKELFFFDQYFHLGEAWYLKHFAEVTTQHRAIGEISHDYLFSVSASQRIHDALPRVKLIACLREPVERAFSSWLYMRKQGRLDRDFGEAMTTVAELVDHGLYAKHLRSYYERFDRSLIYTPLFDDLKADSDAFAQEIFSFLDVDPLPLSEELANPVNSASEARHMGLARIARQAGVLVRRAGRPELVTGIKSSPILQKTLYRQFDKGTRPILDPTLHATLKELFREDVRELAALTGQDVVSRWGY